MPHAERHLLTAPNGSYSIFIAWPEQPPPPEGYGAIFLLDANAAFGTMVEAMRLQSRRPAATGVKPLAVVGIGYPTDELLDVERRSHDLVPANPELRAGGADRLLDLIEEQVVPLAKARLPLDPRFRSIFGHSLGGLFVLHALFTRPALFANYVAASPSIWVDAALVGVEARNFIANPATPAGRRLMMTVGEEEQPAPTGGGPNPHVERLGAKRMLDNARALAATLQEKAGSLLETRLVVFPEENHASVLPAAISRALRFCSGHAG